MIETKTNDILIIETTIHDPDKTFDTASVTTTHIKDVAKRLVQRIMHTTQRHEVIMKNQYMDAFDRLILTLNSVDDMVKDIHVTDAKANSNDEKIVFPESPKDWGTPTGSFIISDGEDVILAHHAADEDEDEWTEISAEYELKKKGAINTSEIPDGIKTEIIVAWIKETVAYHEVVPMDESNSEALIYNLVHLAQDGDDYEEGSYGPYNYEPHQDAEIKSWNI